MSVDGELLPPLDPRGTDVEKLFLSEDVRSY